MRVDDDDGDDDGGDDKHHGEEHVFSYEGDGAGGGGDQLHDNEQEDSQGQQDGDGQSHLFTWGGQTRHTETVIIGLSHTSSDVIFQRWDHIVFCRSPPPLLYLFIFN